MASQAFDVEATLNKLTMPQKVKLLAGLVRVSSPKSAATDQLSIGVVAHSACSRGRRALLEDE
jgi:hypothetical protein